MEPRDIILANCRQVSSPVSPTPSMPRLKAKLADADQGFLGIGLPADPGLKLARKRGMENSNLGIPPRGIQAARALGSNAPPVAESAVGLMIAIIRRTSWRTTA